LNSAMTTFELSPSRVLLMTNCRRLDVTRTKREFGFLAQTSLVDGLRPVARPVITWAFH
jgi:hypothetical protein